MQSFKRAQYKAYSQATQTVAKTRQVVMLYDGAIRFIKQAKEAIRENRIEDRYHLLVKASNIVLGLQGCIDFERGGPVAQMLYDFYSAIDTKLVSIHRTNSLECCDQVLAELKDMRKTWGEIDQSVNNNGGPSPAASPSALASEPAVQPKISTWNDSASLAISV